MLYPEQKHNEKFIMQIQQDHNRHFGKINISVVLKKFRLKQFKVTSNLKSRYYNSHESNKTPKNWKKKVNLNTKRHLMQNDENADTTLLHPHDDL